MGVRGRHPAGHGVEQRFLSAGDRLYAEHRRRADLGIGPGHFAERAFGRDLVGQDLAFEHELGVGRHFDVDGLALHQPHGLAEQAAGNRKLVHAERRDEARREHDQRVAADHHCRFHRAAELPVHLVDAHGLARQHVVAGGVAAENLGAMHRHVADAGFRILDDAHAGCDVAAGIALRSPDRRDLHEVHGVAGFDDLLHGALLHEHRRDGLREAAGEGRDHFGLRDAERDGPHRAIHHQLACDLPAGKSGHIGEVASLVQRRIRLVRDRRNVVVHVGGLVEAMQHAGGLQRLEMAPQRLRGHACGQWCVHG